LNGEIIAKKQLKKTKGRETISIPLKSVKGKHDLYFRFSNPKTKQDHPVCGIVWFAFREALPGKKDEAYLVMNRDFMKLLNAEVENTPILIEGDKNQKRDTHIFERGNWLVKGHKVDPQVPGSLNPFTENYSADRLGFSHWLMSKDNPLTGRTLVNRLWEQLFGSGLVETLEDFGTQGAQPSHPELLDWLALRAMNDHQWSIKKTLKDMVMSGTYRQSSQVLQEHLEKDQSNRWLARAPRIRLSAEQVRDQALAVSALLSKKMFGPSVMPYQPQGIWQTVYNGEYWKMSTGADQHRRGVYTFIKRTSPYPSMMMFDGSSREVCLSRRIRTNTPLQALVTLNDSVYMEAAIGLARSMMKHGNNPPERIRAGYDRLTFKPIPETKLTILRNLYQEALKEYQRNEEGCKKFIQSETADPVLAAMTVVANAMLNLDEVIMKE
jgi:hypothetical protein